MLSIHKPLRMPHGVVKSVHMFFRSEPGRVLAVARNSVHLDTVHGRQLACLPIKTFTIVQALTPLYSHGNAAECMSFSWSVVFTSGLIFSGLCCSVTAAFFLNVCCFRIGRLCGVLLSF